MILLRLSYCPYDSDLILGLLFTLLVSFTLNICCFFVHILPKKPEPEEEEFQKRARELVELRTKYELLIKAHPEERDALEVLYQNARREIIERPMPDKKDTLRRISYE